MATYKKLNLTNQEGIISAIEDIEATLEIVKDEVVNRAEKVIVETLSDSDATDDVITFSDVVNTVEISHSEETSQEFIVNGVTIAVPDGGYRVTVGGTPAAEVTLPTGVTCIVMRFE